MSQMKVSQEIVLLNPQAEHLSDPVPLAPRLPTLKGATIAILNGLWRPWRASFPMPKAPSSCKGIEGPARGAVRAT